MAERLNLSDKKRDKGKAKAPVKAGATTPAIKRKKAEEDIEAQEAKVKTKAKSLADEDDGEDEDDEELFDGLEKGGSEHGKMLFGVAAVLVVLVVIVVFLLLRGGRKQPDPQQSQPPVQSQQGQQQTQPSTSGQQPIVPPTSPAASASSGSGTTTPGNDVGTQDFTGNTTMTTSETLTDPDKFIEDLYGLTTRVDYTVTSITSVADFVSYTKHRGTWGGGLELYWLDVEYREKKYVVQVPFKYYKELTETGIVPVKMEVLTIMGSTPEEALTVVSYMQLDEATLKTVLKSQSKK